MAISERLFPKLDENGQEKAKDYMELLLQSGLYSQKNSIIYQFPRRTLKLYDLPVSAGTGQFLDSDSFSEMDRLSGYIGKTLWKTVILEFSF